MRSRATMADCLALLALPEDERRPLVREMDLMHAISRYETYTVRTCATKDCFGKVWSITSDLCNKCYTGPSQ